MRRREFISLVGGAAVSWPLAARAQQPAKLPTVGFIGSDTPDAYAVLLRAFRVGLKATGFIEGQNVAIEYRWAEGRNDKLSEFAVDLVRRQVAVIVAPTTPSVLAAKAGGGSSRVSPAYARNATVRYVACGLVWLDCLMLRSWSCIIALIAMVGCLSKAAQAADETLTLACQGERQMRSGLVPGGWWRSRSRWVSS
jgi:hypothetical protein